MYLQAGFLVIWNYIYIFLLSILMARAHLFLFELYIHLVMLPNLGPPVRVGDK